MKIKIINPNITLSMTKKIKNIAETLADAETEIIAVSPMTGPESIECYVDEYLSIPGIIEEVRKGDREEEIDAFIIACFGDPGLYAAREVTMKPVLGIAESAITVAKIIAPYFSILSVLDRSRKITEDLVANYGAKSFCKSIRSTGLEVLEFEKNPEEGFKALFEQGKQAITKDGAECIILGCAGFVNFAESLEKELEVPVLDGVKSSVVIAEALVRLGVKTSKKNSYKSPEKKIIKGFDNIVNVGKMFY